MVEILVNAMSRGVKVLDWTPDASTYHNDNIHPCVRYIPQFAGHDWWMVTTPFYGGDDSVENPILYYGDSGANGTPPLSWQGGNVVEPTPSSGYNSDGNLYFDGTQLWIIWRENGTPDCNVHGVDRGIFARSTTNGTTFSDKIYLCGNDFALSGKQGDTVMCPCVLTIGSSLKMLAAYYEFSPVHQPFGFALWDATSISSNSFSHEKNVAILHDPDFNFWHFDIFTYDSKYYCVASPQVADSIYMGVSDDGINFTFWGTPLISQNLYGDYYYYKPSALVKDGTLYLWHPVKNAGVSSIWMDSRSMAEVLAVLNNNIASIK